MVHQFILLPLLIVAGLFKINFNKNVREFSGRNF